MDRSEILCEVEWKLGNLAGGCVVPKQTWVHLGSDKCQQELAPLESLDSHSIQAKHAVHPQQSIIPMIPMTPFEILVVPCQLVPLVDPLLLRIHQLTHTKKRPIECAIGRPPRQRPQPLGPVRFGISRPVYPARARDGQVSPPHWTHWAHLGSRHPRTPRCKDDVATAAVRSAAVGGVESRNTPVCKPATMRRVKAASEGIDVLEGHPALEGY